MRIEEIEREAKIFDREGETYIHVERAKNTPYKVIISGDFNTTMQGIFNILCYMCTENEISFRNIIRQLKRAYRTVGLHKYTDD